MFTLKQGRTKFMWLPMTVSTAIGTRHLVAFNGSSGYLIEATSSSAVYYIMGVLRHAIASTDSDYATARLVEVEVPIEKYVVWEGDATGLTATTDVGLYKDLTDGDHVNGAASSIDVCFCVKYISATKGWFILNIGPDAHTKA